jgi:hypothetical protein
MSFFGQKLFEALKAAPVEAWIAFAVVVVAVIGTVFALRRRTPRAAPAESAPGE